MSVISVLKNFRGRIAITYALVVAEEAAWIAFPLVIGFAINDVLAGTWTGVWMLGGLGVVALWINGARRFFDSRVYAKIYEALSARYIEKSKADTTTKTAQLQLLGEMVEFLENSLPGLSHNIIGLAGTLFILAFLDFRVTIGCAIVLLVIVLVYWATSKRTISHNQSFNDELEQRVTIVDNNRDISGHIRRLMKFNIKLSDIEVVNFSIVWVFMMGLLVFAIVTIGSKPDVEYGTVFSVVMYVFEFMEAAGTLPLFYQQGLRLKEIFARIKRGLDEGPEEAEVISPSSEINQD